MRWDTPPLNPELKKDTAHVWAVDLDRDTLWDSVLADTLASDERERADRFRSDKDQAHFVAARGSLRVMLSRYLSADPRELAFVYGKLGKPALAEPWDETRLQFNVSHSNGLGLVAVCWQYEIGVDVEHQSRRVGQMDHIAKRFFASGEHKMLRALSEADQSRAFFNCWTRKEAFVKATGLGLAHSLKDFEVSVGDDASLLRAKSVDVAQWTLQHLDVGNGYIGAVAIGGRDVAVNCWMVEPV